MPHFDMLDICEAYAKYASDYNVGGYATGRKEAYRGETNSDINVRLTRIHFHPRGSIFYDENLTKNGQEIYDALVARRGY